MTPPELQTADVSGSRQSDFCVQVAPALAAPESQTPGLRVQSDALVQLAPALTASMLQAPDLAVQVLSALQAVPSLPDVAPHLPSLVQALFLIVVLPVQAMAGSLVQ